MKTAGIIAEYNPFHKGHKYQIEKLREIYRPDYVVIAMSGDFLQRGTPALMNKYARAQMALLQGADLILELPACFATASAEGFARGGIRLFETAGLTDVLCFGAESDDLTKLRELASLLNRDPDWYREALQANLRSGLSFPAARAKALPDYAGLLDTPNNILAVEYLKAMENASGMTPLLIQRKGNGYHDASLSGSLASASAIRKELLKNTDFGSNHTIDDSSLSSRSPRLADALPPESLRIMQEYEKQAAFLKEDNFSLLLHHALLRETAASLERYLDITPELANRIIAQRNHFHSWSSFCERCKSKNITYTGISRALTHILLGIERKRPYSYKEGISKHLPYLRVLGFKKSAAPLLTELKRCAKAPVITNPAAASKQLTEEGLAMLHTDIYASDLYRSVFTNMTGKIYPNEYQRKMLAVD